MSISQYEIWNRAETGNICPIKDFEYKTLFPNVQKLVKKYGIKYDPETLVPLDETLIDNVYQAGVELLVNTGILCTSTERVIKFTESEINDKLNGVKSEVVVGTGQEAKVMKHRGIEDKTMPIMFAGPVCVPITEEIADAVYESYANEESLGTLYPGTLTEVCGIPVVAGGPTEMHAEKKEIARLRTAFRSVGRPGICIEGTSYCDPISSVGACNDEWGYHNGDMLHAYIMPNMKVDYEALNRAAHSHHCGIIVQGGGTSFIGGFAGGPEGAAIVGVAETIAAVMLFDSEINDLWTPDTLYPPGLAARKPMWATSLGLAAMAKHTKLPMDTGAPYQAYAGPCTDMYLYEIAASTIAYCICGAHPMTGGGLQGIEHDYFGGPLDTKFMSEVARASLKMDRKQANDIVKKILAKYEDRIIEKNPPRGKKFQECNDMKTLQPTQEYLDLYYSIKEELTAMGVDFD